MSRSGAPLCSRAFARRARFGIESGPWVWIVSGLSLPTACSLGQRRCEVAKAAAGFRAEHTYQQKSSAPGVVRRARLRGAYEHAAVEERSCAAALRQLGTGLNPVVDRRDCLVPHHDISQDCCDGADGAVAHKGADFERCATRGSARAAVDTLDVAMSQRRVG